MNGKQLKENRKLLNWTQSDLAAILMVHKMTIWRWEQDKYPIPPLVEGFINEKLYATMTIKQHLFT